MMEGMPETEWYFVHKGEVKGPLGMVDLVQLWGDELIEDDTPVWAPGREKWQPFGEVEELVAATEEPAAAKRGRQEEGGEPPERQELPAEAATWLAELDEEALAQLLFVAIMRYKPHVIEGLAAARDVMLASFLTRFPGAEEAAATKYKFSDTMFFDALDDLNKEGLWELAGQGNEDAVRAVVRSACELDEHFLSRAYAFWACAKARRLIAAKDLEGLLALLGDDAGLVMTRDMHGRTVLHSLAAAGDGELLRQVLEKVPAMASQRDAVDENLETPLHLAARAGGAAAVAALLAVGANPNQQNRDQSEYASGNWSVKRRDVEFCMPVPSHHQTPLHIAAEAGDHDLMRVLINAGARLDIRDTAGCTPLHYTLEAQDLEGTQLLLAAGADPTLANSEMGDDSTPLHAVCAAGQAALAEALLATGRLDVNRPGAQGWYPLHLAVRRGSLPCVELLLQQGAEINVTTEQGKTPLDLALVNKRAAIAERLRGAGACTSEEREQQQGAAAAR